MFKTLVLWLTFLSDVAKGAETPSGFATAPLSFYPYYRSVAYAGFFNERGVEK